MNKTSRDLLIVNKRGLHARASAKFVGVVSELPDGVKVRVAKDGTEAEGGSILGLMMLGAAMGDTITLTVDGPDCEHAIARLATVVESGFDEE